MDERSDVSGVYRSQGKEGALRAGNDVGVTARGHSRDIRGLSAWPKVRMGDRSAKCSVRGDEGRNNKCVLVYRSALSFSERQIQRRTREGKRRTGGTVVLHDCAGMDEFEGVPRELGVGGDFITELRELCGGRGEGEVQSGVADRWRADGRRRWGPRGGRDTSVWGWQCTGEAATGGGRRAFPCPISRQHSCACPSSCLIRGCASPGSTRCARG